jgi:hypothetical protein
VPNPSVSSRTLPSPPQPITAVGAEAVPGLAAATGPAGPVDRAPVEDHEVARGEVGDALADGLDEAGGFVAEQERELVVDAALAVVQVGVAHPAGLHLHHRLARAGIGDDDRLDRHRVALLVRDDPANLLRHPCSPPPARLWSSLPRVVDDSGPTGTPAAPECGDRRCRGAGV